MHNVKEVAVNLPSEQNPILPPLSLTELEIIGLSAAYNFADGHAAHDDNELVAKAVQELPTLWKNASTSVTKDIELQYKSSFAALINSQALANHQYFSICPTASTSIDIVAAYLNAQRLRTALLEPTFDNLALLLKRRCVDIIALPEQYLREIELLEGYIKDSKINALFLVNPNNPTGWHIDSLAFQQIINLCAKYEITLIIDVTFRLFLPIEYNDYELLIESGINFIVIEDTGKVWPTQEIKASLLVYCQKIAGLVRQIYEEIFLCVSNVSLLFLKYIFDLTKTHGFTDTIYTPVTIRREQFRKVIAGSMLEIDPSSWHSKISVEWVKIRTDHISDLHAIEIFQKYQISILPGSLFYWNNKAMGNLSIRFALLKPMDKFEQSLKALSELLQDI